MTTFFLDAAVSPRFELFESGVLVCVSGPDPVLVSVDNLVVALSPGGPGHVVDGHFGGTKPTYAVSDPVTSAAAPVPRARVMPFTSANVALAKRYAPSLSIAVAPPPPRVDLPVGEVTTPAKIVVITLVTPGQATFSLLGSHQS